MGSDKFHLVQILSGLDIGGGHGGAERFGVELSRHIDRQAFRLSLCAFWKRGTEVETHWLNLLRSEGIPVFFAAEWKGRFRIGAYCRGLKVLSAYCRREEATLLHSHFQMGTLASILVKSMGGAKAVLRTAHITLEWGEGFVAWLLRRIFTDCVFPLTCDREVGVSQAVVDQLLSHPGARFSKFPPLLIHNAVPTQAFQKTPTQALPEVLSSVHDGPIIGSIGRLSRQKGYRYLLEAAPRVLYEFPGARFIIIGDGELRKKLEGRAFQLGIRERVLFTGKVEDVLPFLQRMDLFVLPSLWEGFPTVLMESMACGVPVVATDVPGTRELIRDQVSGWLAPAQDARLLADAILDALRNPQKRERFALVAKECVERFDIEAISRDYERCYHDLLIGKDEL